MRVRPNLLSYIQYLKPIAVAVTHVSELVAATTPFLSDIAMTYLSTVTSKSETPHTILTPASVYAQLSAPR